MSNENPPVRQSILDLWDAQGLVPQWFVEAMRKADEQFTNLATEARKAIEVARVALEQRDQAIRERDEARALVAELAQALRAFLNHPYLDIPIECRGDLDLGRIALAKAAKVTP